MNNAPTTPRSYSLQREWSRAFTLMLLALLLGAVVTIVGVRFVVNEMEDAASRLHAEYASVAALTEALESHQLLGHQLLATAPVSRQEFVREQKDIERLFEEAAAVKAVDGGRPEALAKARQDWQAGLEKGGLWGDKSLTRTGNSVADAPAFAAASSNVRTQLAAVQHASLAALTGLGNRAALAERLAASFEPETGIRTRHEGLLFIDIDDFKEVNDSLGHEGGDALLVQLAHRLQASVRSQDLVARLGGDEFAVVVVDYDDGTPATGPVADRIYQSLSEPFVINGRSLRVSLSMGVAQRTADAADVTELLRQADSAMYRAKHGGKARYEIHGGGCAWWPPRNP